MNKKIDKNVGIAEIVCTSFKTHPVIVLDRGTFFWESEMCGKHEEQKSVLDCID